MKHKFKLLGTIALVAIIGFSMVSCDTDDTTDSIDQVVIVQNLSNWAADDPVTMVLTSLSAAAGDYLAGPREIRRNQQWEVSRLPIGEQLMVVVIDDGGLGFGTYPFTLAAGETKTLVYRGGGSYAAGPSSNPSGYTSDDFPIGD